jgi:hypothetical protein
MAESAEAPVVTGAGERRFTVPSPYNRMILAQRLSRTTPVVLASRRASTGLTLSTLHAACLHLVTEVDLADRPSWIRRFVAERAPKLFDGDRLVTDPEEQARVIEAQLDEFCARRVPELFALGILAD